MPAAVTNRSPLKRVLVLAAVFTVLAVLGFGYGAYLGDRHRDGVRDVAFNVFAMGLPPGMADASFVADAPALPEKRPLVPAQGQAAPLSQDAAVGSTPTNAPAVAPHAQERPDATPVQTPTGAAPQAPPAASVPPAALDLPVTVRVKVLVDEPFIQRHPDWPSQVQRLLALASAAYQKATRIEFELMGVSRFAAPLTGLSAPELQQLLAQQDRDGADVLLGVVDRTLPGTACAVAPGERHGVHGLVGRSDGSDLLHATLRCFGVLLGGAVVADPQSEAYRLGSWMREGAAPAAGRTWLDGDNRARIMASKALPFPEEAR